MSIQGSMCLDEMLPMEDQMPEVVVLDSLESCRCVFIQLFVLNFYRGEGLMEGLRRPAFFFTFFTFCLTHDQPYESMTGPIGHRLLT